jgi:hypothetical protein
MNLPSITHGIFKAPGLLDFTLKEVEFVAEAHRFAAGLYIVIGGAEAGKSVIGRGIAASAIASGWQDVAVLPVFEPNSPPYPDYFLDDAKFINDNPVSPVGPADAFVGDLGRWLGTWQSTRAAASATQAMLVIDSLARPMRGYLPEARKSMAAMTGGFYLADLAFVQRVNDICVRMGLTILGVVSNELVPFAKILNGVAQGIVTCENFAQFIINDRPTRRQGVRYKLSMESLTDAFDALGYTTDDLEVSYTRLQNFGASILTS